MKRAPARDIVWLFLLSRVGLVVVTYFAYTLLNGPRYAGPPVDVMQTLTSWRRWDVVHYMEIARYGYRNIFDTAFFPLFPLLIGIVAHLAGNQGYLLIGTLISNLALLGTLFTLYLLAVEVSGEQVARRTLLYLCIFPTALFFFAAYNESLFLLLVTSVFLALRRHRWWLAGLLGMLAALTRSPGLLLVVPYLWELWLARADLGAPTEPGGPPVAIAWRSLIWRALPILLIPLGTALYSYYCWRLFGSPVTYATVQYRWAHSTVWPWAGIWKALVGLFWAEPPGSLFEAHILLDLSATLGFVVLAVLGWRRLPMSFNLWIALLLLLYLVEPSINQPDPLISNQRFVLEMFPGFITLAALGCQHPRLHQTIVLLFPLLLATLSILFLMGRWMV